MANIGSYPRQGGSNIGPNQRNAVAVTEAHIAVVHRESLVGVPAGATQDFVVPGFGTPKGYIVTFSNADELETNKPHARMSFGVCDFTNSYCVSATSATGQTTTVCKSTASSAHVGLLIANDGASIKGEISDGGVITDGVRLIYDTSFPTLGPKRISVTLIGGDDDMDCLATTKASDATAGNTATITTTFEPEQGIFASCQRAPSGTPTISAHARMHIGFWDAAAGSHDQGSVNWHDRDAADAPTVGTRRGMITSGAYVMHGLSATETSDGAIEVTSVTSTTCVLTTREDNVSNDVICLLWSTGDTTTRWLEQLDAPTATGAQTSTNPGETPRGMFSLSCRSAAALGTTPIVADTANVIGFGIFGPSKQIAFPGQTGEFSVMISSDDNAASSNTYSRYSDDGIHTGNVAGSDFMHASVLNDLGGGTGEGWNADGWTADWGNVVASANHIWYLGFGEPSSSTTVVMGSAVGTATGGALTVSAGSLSVSVGSAIATATAPALTVDTGVQTVTPGSAVATGVGGALTVAPGSLTVPLGSATATATGAALTVAPGSLAVALGAAVATATATTPAVLSVVVLGTATATATSTAPTVVPGALAVALGSAIATAVGGAVTIPGVALFYEAAANAVRSRWKSEIADPYSVTTQYDNLPGFTKPSTIYAQVAVEFEDAQLDAVGGSGILTRADGTLRVWIHQPIYSGSKAAVDAADLTLAAFREVRDSTSVGDDVVRFYSPSIIRRYQSGARYVVELACPFRAEQTAAVSSRTTPILGLDSQDVGAALRGLWASDIETALTLPTQYDALPFTRPAATQWARVTVLDGDPIHVHVGLTRLVGVFACQVFTPAEMGEKDGLGIVDTINQVFRHRDIQGLRTGAPRVGTGTRSGPWWQHTVSVPWTADQLT